MPLGVQSSHQVWVMRHRGRGRLPTPSFTAEAGAAARARRLSALPQGPVRPPKTVTERSARISAVFPAESRPAASSTSANTLKSPQNPESPFSPKRGLGVSPKSILILF